MKIAIVDKNPVVRDYFECLLKDYAQVVKQDNPYIKEEFDFIFTGIPIEIKVKAFVVYLSLKDDVLDEADYIMKKDITPKMFKKVFPVLIKLREFLKAQEDMLSYKEQQEIVAIKKQMKFIKNTLMMFYEDDVLIESIFKPKDILSGDAIISKRISSKKYFFMIIDAMGKGVGASLTTTNLSSYLYYLINNFDFNFKQILEKFVDYAKSVLLEGEVLSFVAVCIDHNRVSISNFAMPPVYVDREKVKANNSLLTLRSNKKVDIVNKEFSNDVLLFSDGLIEAELKEGGIYFSRFKKILKEFNFLNELYKDFKHYAIQSDDLSMVFLRKEPPKELIFKKNYIMDESNMMNILEEFEHFGDKMVFILNELILNSYEHVLLKIKNKEEYVKEEQVIQNSSSIEVFIEVYKYKDYFILKYCDSGEGFDLMLLSDLEDRKYHARGIKMIKHISDGVFFNKKGNCVKVYIKEQ